MYSPLTVIFACVMPHKFKISPIMRQIKISSGYTSLKLQNKHIQVITDMSYIRYPVRNDWLLN
jgi:hypothetical protein